jgi:hypothetical protein
VRAAAAGGLSLLALVLGAAPAPAATVARGQIVAGPALAGDRVAWAELTDAGRAARVLTGAPGMAPAVIHELPAATAPETRRGFLQTPSAFDASAEAVAGLAFTGTVIFRDSDVINEAIAEAVVGGPLAGPLDVLAGTFPQAVSDEPCSGSYVIPEAVAVDGARIAIAEESGSCPHDVAPQLSVALIDAAGRRAVPLARGGQFGNLALSGRLVAWTRNDRRETLFVQDVETGEVVRKVKARALGATYFDTLALRPDGGIAFTYGGLRNSYGIRLGWLPPGSDRVRVLDRHAGGAALAIAGRRVLYERVLRTAFHTRLVLRRLRVADRGRVLARFGERATRLGTVDFDGDRATWVAQPNRRGAAARVVLVSGL